MYVERLLLLDGLNAPVVDGLLRVVEPAWAREARIALVLLYYICPLNLHAPFVVNLKSIACYVNLMTPRMQEL